MNVKLRYIFTFISIIFLFYFTTLATSLIGISKAMDENDPIKLDYYIQNELLKNNLNMFFFEKLKLKFDNKKISMDINDMNFSGELSDKSIETLIYDISVSLSDSFSKPNVLLFFYYEPNEIDQYIEKIFLNRGNYSFQEYSENKTPKNNGNEIINSNANSKNIFKKLSKINISFDNLFNKLKKPEYFFFTNPLTFKLKVIHELDSYSIFLKLNGLKWSIVHFEFDISDHTF
ncbi:hypothetical protein OAC08_03125 [Pelagibacterales bacterium]|nr:hypothetical protein [Pelagibacterales bacterium]